MGTYRWEGESVCRRRNNRSQHHMSEIFAIASPIKSLIQQVLPSSHNLSSIYVTSHNDAGRKKTTLKFLPARFLVPLGWVVCLYQWHEAADVSHMLISGLLFGWNTMACCKCFTTSNLLFSWQRPCGTQHSPEMCLAKSNTTEFITAKFILYSPPLDAFLYFKPVESMEPRGSLL